MIFLSLLGGCGFTSGFNGESKTQIGSVEFVSCGDETLPDIEKEKPEKIYLTLGNINHDSLVEDADDFKKRLADIAHGRCEILEKSGDPLLKDNEGYLGFRKVNISNHFPFSHVGDKEECFRAEGSVYLALRDTTMDFRFEFNNSSMHFDRNIAKWLETVCR